MKRKAVSGWTTDRRPAVMKVTRERVWAFGPPSTNEGSDKTRATSQSADNSKAAGHTLMALSQDGGRLKVPNLSATRVTVSRSPIMSQRGLIAPVGELIKYLSVELPVA
jgi:hypothetical protein